MKEGIPGARRQPPGRRLLRHVAAKSGRAVLCFLTFSACLLGALATIAPTMHLGAVDDAAPAVESPPEAVVLARRHDCWAGEAPNDMRGRLPGHVVVTIDGRTRYAGPRVAARALEQVFGGVDHGMIVHAFCR